MVRPSIELIEITWSAPVVIGYRSGQMLMGGWPPKSPAQARLASGKYSIA